jgi:hypothetical protein
VCAPHWVMWHIKCACYMEASLCLDYSYILSSLFGEHLFVYQKHSISVKKNFFIAKYRLNSAIYSQSIPRPDVVLHIKKVKTSKKLEEA